MNTSDPEMTTVEVETQQQGEGGGLPSSGAPQVPDKFMRDGKPDYDAMVKSYLELEKRVSSGNQEQTQQQEQQTQEQTQQQQEQQQESGSFKADTIKSFIEAVRENDGQIPDSLAGTTGLGAEYEEVLASGAMNEKASKIEEVAADAIRNHFGSEQGYMDAIKWAGENWSQEEAKAFSDAVNNADTNPAGFRVMARALASAYQAAEGKQGSGITGIPAGGSGDVYHSEHEMLTDMDHPRYRANDPAYHKMVDDKIRRSMKAGTM